VLRESDRAIPDDVAVIGFDDSMLAPATVPPLTTVHQPVEELGQRMAELLLAQLREESVPPGGVILPTELVIRASA
jgi:LacI family transcriptional regulator